jgi:hypothetical protein
VLQDVPQSGNRQGDEPDQRNRPEEQGHARRAARLYGKEPDQYQGRDRHHVGLEGWRDDFDALNCGENGKRRRDDGIAVEQAAADDTQ